MKSGVMAYTAKLCSDSNDQEGFGSWRLTCWRPACMPSPFLFCALQLGPDLEPPAPLSFGLGVCLDRATLLLHQPGAPGKYVPWERTPPLRNRSWWISTPGSMPLGLGGTPELPVGVQLSTVEVCWRMCSVLASFPPCLTSPPLLGAESCPPRTLRLKSSLPVPQNGALFGKRVAADVISYNEVRGGR